MGGQGILTYFGIQVWEGSIYFQADIGPGKLTFMETHAQVIPRGNLTSQFTLTQTGDGHPGASSKLDWSIWFSLIHSYPQACPTIDVSERSIQQPNFHQAMHSTFQAGPPSLRGAI